MCAEIPRVEPYKPGPNLGTSLPRKINLAAINLAKINFLSCINPIIHTNVQAILTSCGFKALDSLNMALTTSEPSLIVFGPQTELSSRDAIDQLRQELNQNPQLFHVLNAAKHGPELWKSLVDFDPTLKHIPGAKLLAELQEWVAGDGPLPSHNFNTFRLPVTVLLEIAQYFRYLKQLNVVSPHRVLLEGVKTGGVLGFCVGFLSAIAVATSEIEAEVAFTAAAVFRLAVIIGAYVDNNQFGIQGTKVGCIAVRWKGDEVHEQDISSLISTFPRVFPLLFWLNSQS